ncbi:MAG: anaerobic ribonucleoside-triphosphate reductase activating protein, partial [Bacilli bacterium]|nr:anaerobic ribonucleoside-triphosphate reductase activating protein [Bacilli bacterium]
KSVMKIGGLNKLTTQDFPEHLACIIFTKGCNFNCSYCYNRDLVDNKAETIDEDYVMAYLYKRRKILDGVVISGGEPTIWDDLIPFIKKVKEFKLDIKLDTNGYNPTMLKEILDNNLVDYIAMDIKAIPDKYMKVINKKIDFNKILESIDLIKKSNIKYEFRTTIMKDVHDKNDIIKILKLIGDSKLYLQNFQCTDVVKDKNIKSFSRDELLKLKEELKEYPNVIVRYV